MQVPGGELPRSRLSASRAVFKQTFHPMKTGPGLIRGSTLVMRSSCCAWSGAAGCEEGFDVGDGFGDAVGREGLEEYLAVALGGDAWIEEDEDAAVLERADEAAEALLESEDRLGDLVVEEGTAAGFLDGAHAGLDDGVGGNGERQAIDDDATEGFALHVDSLPEAGGAEEDGVGGGTEFLEESFSRSGAVEEKRKIEDGKKALVEGAHLGVAGEEAEGAAAGDSQDTLDGGSGRGDEVRIARIRHGGWEIEECLLAIAEVRGDDELAGLAEVETAADVLEAALNREGCGGEDNGGDLLEDESAKELGDVDGCGLESTAYGRPLDESGRRTSAPF